MVEIRSLNSARQEASGIRMVLLAVWYWMASHIALTVAIFGGIMMAIGAIVLSGPPAPPGVYRPPLNNIFAGMFGVWGFSLIVLGVFFDVLFRLIGFYQNWQATGV